MKRVDYLLRNHDNESRKGGAANPRDRKELKETRKVVRPAQDRKPFHQLVVHVVQISRLKLGVSQAPEGRVGVLVACCFHNPSWRFFEREA
jgi:hypothetical protein